MQAQVLQPEELAHKLYARLCAGLSLPKATTRAVCDKARLARCKLSCTPEAFVLGPGRDCEAAAFWTAFQRARGADGKKQLWLAKPPDGRCGRGIIVFDDEGTARRAMESTGNSRSSRAGQTVVLQRYLMDPLLLGGVKFDVRAHVVIITAASVESAPRCLLHARSSYARFATGHYNTDQLDVARHLTNVCLREAASGRSARTGADPQPTSRRTVPLPHLLEQLAAAGSQVSGDAVVDAVCDASAECMCELLRQHQEGGSREESGGRLQVLGLDIMLDASGKAWLIEVNHSPYMRFKSDPTSRALAMDLVKLALGMKLATADSLGLHELHWQPSTDDDESCWHELHLGS